jgi:DNA-binding HxlR family transcriptional regulator
MTTLNTKQPICLPSLKILSDYWTLRIIDELSDGTALRFNELERRLESVNTATLSKRLKDMQESELISRTEASRADVAYTLTELGNEAIPLLNAVNHFSTAKQRLTRQK